MAYKDQGIKTPSDLYKRELFREVLDISESSGITISEIIDDYCFSKDNAIKCGIKSCRTPHQQGYLALTSLGLETNIGNVCGANHGGGKFTVAKNIFDLEKDRQNKRDRIKAFKQEAARLRDDIDTEVEAARIAQRRSREFKHDHPVAWQFLLSMSKTRSSVIVNDDLLNTDDAVKLFRRVRPSVKLKKWKRIEKPTVSNLEISVAGIHGLFYDFKGNLIDFSQSTINEALNIDEKSIDGLNDKQLKLISEAIKKIPTVLEDSRKAVCENHVFFSPDNIDKIYYIPGIYTPGRRYDYS